ncbi:MULTISPECIES: hypothetical protein [unclassified Mesorhizobium]|nr:MULTISPECIES: hypothetical protein [unclassified Mesorhizobium]
MRLPIGVLSAKINLYHPADRAMPIAATVPKVINRLEMTLDHIS